MGLVGVWIWIAGCDTRVGGFDPFAEVGENRLELKKRSLLQGSQGKVLLGPFFLLGVSPKPPLLDRSSFG